MLIFGVIPFSLSRAEVEAGVRPTCHLQLCLTICPSSRRVQQFLVSWKPRPQQRNRRTHQRQKLISMNLFLPLAMGCRTSKTWCFNGCRDDLPEFEVQDSRDESHEWDGRGRKLTGSPEISHILCDLVKRDRTWQEWVPICILLLHLDALSSTWLGE